MMDAKERGEQLMSVSVTDMRRSMTDLMLGRSLYGSAFLTMAVRTLLHQERDIIRLTFQRGDTGRLCKILL